MFLCLGRKLFIEMRLPEVAMGGWFHLYFLVLAYEFSHCLSRLRFPFLINFDYDCNNVSVAIVLVPLDCAGQVSCFLFAKP